MPATHSLLCLLLAFVAVARAPAMGAEYFVATTGDDRAGGLSEKDTFATIARGVSVLKPGDVLTILPGEYRESISTSLSGRKGAPISIRARYPGSVLLRGDVDVAGFRPVAGMHYTYALDFSQRVEGIAERSTFKVYQYQPSVAEVERNNGSFYQDEKTGRLYVHTTDCQRPENHALSVSLTRKHGFLLQGSAAQWASDVVIDGLSFTGYQVRDYPVNGPGQNIWLGLCIQFAERITVRRCSAFLNSGGIWVSLCQDLVVEDCRAFGNRSYHYPLGKNLMGWGVHNVTFRRNLVEGFTRDNLTSEDDIVFYGGQAQTGPFAGKDGRVFMLQNTAVDAGIMIKGAFTQDSEQTGNVAFGHGAYFYRNSGRMNVLISGADEDALAKDYVDPINHDYRLQSDSKLRGTGPGGSDPGPCPYSEEVYFVAPGGNDAAAGTSVKAAWRTLAHAARKAQPGHTVYVVAGEYQEALVPVQSGAEEKPIRFLRRGRDRVVIDGGNRLPVGIDLSGRSHIVCSGFLIKGCTQAGVAASQGQDLRIERMIVLGSGGDGIIARGVQDLHVQHNLLRRNRGFGIRLEGIASGSVTANVLDSNARGGVRWDTASAGKLWADYNAYTQGRTPLLVLADRAFESLDAWQKQTACDLHSLVSAPGFRDAAHNDYSLVPDSRLIGRGPQGSAIGPYLRYAKKVFLPVDNVRIRAITGTTATVEYATPLYQQPGPSFWDRPQQRTQGVTIEWGLSPAYGRKLVLPSEWQTAHTVGLVALEPGKEYRYRVSSTAQTEESVFLPFLARKDGAEIVPAITGTFKTLSKDPVPRVFHVATTGDDAKNGLSLQEAWKSIGHAASQVRAGDTVLIHGGTYEEHVVVEATGDKGAPITFRAAPGEKVWMSGSNRRRVVSFRLAAKHYVTLDGLRFRQYNHQSHNDGCVFITGGSGHQIRRCLQDGRNVGGYSGPLLRAHDAPNLLVENCVMTLGMDDGLTFWECPGLVVRHCVFYNNQIRAASCFLGDPQGKVEFSHNLFCDVGPTKTSVPMLRLTDLANLRADHNGYFARLGPGERLVLEVSSVHGKPQAASLTLAEVQQRTSQEVGSLFGNPGMKLIKELLPANSPEGEWQKAELLWDGEAYLLLDFGDFVADPQSSFAHFDAGKPIGLDPVAFR